MKTIIVDLPKEQLNYIKENCEEQILSEEVCIMDSEIADLLLYEIERRESTKFFSYLIVSENPTILKKAGKMGIPVAAYLPPEKFGEVALPPVDIMIEGFEEVDFTFFERIHQRHYRIPWTILETERLVVRELDLKDMDDLFELYSYEGMTDYMEGLYPYEEEYEYQKAYIENMYRFFDYGMWLVFEKESGKLIGRAGIEHRKELEGELELGYAIGTPFWGRGYATEVCEAILNYTSEKLGFKEICSLVQPENKVSVHLLEKLGFTFETELVLESVHYKKYKKKT